MTETLTEVTVISLKLIGLLRTSLRISYEIWHGEGGGSYNELEEWGVCFLQQKSFGAVMVVICDTGTLGFAFQVLHLEVLRVKLDTVLSSGQLNPFL